MQFTTLALAGFAALASAQSATPVPTSTSSHISGAAGNSTAGVAAGTGYKPTGYNSVPTYVYLTNSKHSTTAKTLLSSGSIYPSNANVNTKNPAGAFTGGAMPMATAGAGIAAVIGGAAAFFL